MANVTYLLGAGASAKALPVVKEIPNSLDSIITNVNSSAVFPSSAIDTFPESLQKLRNDLQWLKENTEKHSSIDTFAKKLYLTESKDLTRLKYALSGFISICQQINNTDRRYDTFLASILKTSFKEFPNSIKIVSWNYDMQFEKAYYEYLPQNMKDITVEDIANRINVTTYYNYHDYRRIQHDRNLFEIIKLNGHCTNLQYDKSDRPPVVDDSLNSPVTNDIYNLVNNYQGHCEAKEFKRSAISFAWEEQGRWDTPRNGRKFIDYTVDKINETNILVIIGYSFPFFNRDVDMQLWGSIPLEKLSKVYIQDIYPDDIKTKFLATVPSIDPNKIIPLKITPNTPSEEFYLPPELTL